MCHHYHNVIDVGGDLNSNDCEWSEDLYLFDVPCSNSVQAHPQLLSDEIEIQFVLAMGDATTGLEIPLYSDEDIVVDTNGTTGAATGTVSTPRHQKPAIFGVRSTEDGASDLAHTSEDCDSPNPLLTHTPATASTAYRASSPPSQRGQDDALVIAKPRPQTQHSPRSVGRYACEDAWKVIGELWVDGSGTPVACPHAQGGEADVISLKVSVQKLNSPSRGCKRAKSGCLTQVYTPVPETTEVNAPKQISKWQCLLWEAKFYIFPLPPLVVATEANSATIMVREKDGISLNARTLVAVKCGQESFTLYDSLEGNSLWTFACDTEQARDIWSQLINNVAKEAEELALEAKNAKLRSVFTKYGV